jgi:hypothetical protein
MPVFAVWELALTQIPGSPLPAALRTTPLIEGLLAAAFPPAAAMRRAAARAAARTAPTPAGTMVTGLSKVGCPAETGTLAAASGSIEPP